MCPRYAMRVYTVHTKRVMAMAVAIGTMVLLVTVVVLHHTPHFAAQNGSYGGETGHWSPMWYVYRNGVAEKTTVENGTFVADTANGTEDMDSDELVPSIGGGGGGATIAEKSIGQSVGTYSDYDDYESPDEDEDDENENSVFRDGDFDPLPPNMTSTTESGSFRTNASAAEDIGQDASSASLTEHIMDKRGVVSYAVANRGFDRRLQGKSELDPAATSRLVRTPYPETHTAFKFHIVQNFIFWSKDVEKLAPKGLTPSYVRSFQRKLRELTVISMEPPSWNRCGRPKNQYLTMSDGSHVCARYRAPYDYLVQGEVMSFYLGRLLGLDNIPIVVLSKVDPTTKQWGSYPNAEATTAMRQAGWEVNTTVALIQWIDGLERGKMPCIILETLQHGSTISAKTEGLKSASLQQLLELLQWSDLIVFDYITGNYDRVASMQDAADKEQRPDILQDTIHNLVRQRSIGGLWLLDNESGLLDSYSLMYAGYDPSKQGERFLRFQQQMLQTMCVFRRSTFARIRFLYKHRAAHKFLLDHIHQEEPVFQEMPDPTKNIRFVRHFQQRINEVYRWMMHCHKWHQSSKDPT